MASGSRRNFIYKTDKGDEFFYQADEGWTEAIIANAGGTAGSQDYTTTAAVDWGLPSNVTPRTVLLQSLDGKRRAEVIVPTAALFGSINLNGNFTVTDPLNTGSNTLYVTLKKGEQVQFPKPGDTGLQDGDNP